MGADCAIQHSAIIMGDADAFVSTSAELAVAAVAQVGMAVAQVGAALYCTGRAGVRTLREVQKGLLLVEWSATCWHAWGVSKLVGAMGPSVRCLPAWLAGWRLKDVCQSGAVGAEVH